MVWTSAGQYETFIHPLGNFGERFGASVSRTRRRGTGPNEDVLIGAPQADIPGTPAAGEMFVWKY